MEPAQSSEDDSGQDQRKPAELEVTPSGQDAPSSKSPWQYGGFIDAAYLLDFNHPSNHLFSAQLPARWNVRGPWSMTLRPEFAWDSDGRWTGFAQTIKAVTTTLEYRLPYRKTNTILRLEHRYDDSRGRGGGFFRGAEVQPGVVGLTPTQHLLIFGVMLTFDSSFRP